MEKKCKYAYIDYIVVSCLVMLLGGILTYASVNLAVFNPVKRAFQDFSMTDVYYEIQHDEGVTELNSDITLVDMTELYDRKAIANCMNEILKCNPKCVVVDLIFERPGNDDYENYCVSQAFTSSDKIILSNKLIDYNEDNNSFGNCLCSFFYHQDAQASTGYSNVVSGDGYNTIRRYTSYQRCKGRTIYSLSYLAACKYEGVNPKREEPNDRTIIYSDTDFPVVNCKNVHSSRKLIQGKIVFLGTMTDESDMHISPTGKMSGMKIQAFSTLSAINHKDIKQISDYVSIILAMFISYISAYMGCLIDKRFPKTKIYWLKLYYFSAAALIGWFGFYTFVKFNCNISLIYPLVALALVETAKLQYKWILMLLSKYKLFSFSKKSIYYEED